MYKKLLVLLAFGGLVFLHGAASAAEPETSQTITRKDALTTMRGSDKFFTGDVTITPLYPTNNEMRSSGGSVTFQPGARSNWHTHPVGQVLIITEGVGRTGVWGKPFQEVRAGDIVVCPVGVKHWHGASPDSPMTHISICEEKEPGKVVEWLEKVSDEQYNQR